MLQVQDKASGEIVCQVFNFVDQMGGITDKIEGKFLPSIKNLTTNFVYSR